MKQTHGTAINKIKYFSDGASSQYKNKYNLLNLSFHFEDFGINAEWHFFATSHGKNACDGIGGSLKRLAARASLQRPLEEQITTPQKLFDWATANIQNIHFQFSSIEQYQKHSRLLLERRGLAKTISGTRNFHSFIPMDTVSHLKAKVYSYSDKSKVVAIIK